MYFHCWFCEILWEVARDLRLCPQCHDEGALSVIDIPIVVEIIELQPVEEEPMVNRPIVFFDTGPIEFTAQDTRSTPCYVCLSDIEGKVIFAFLLIIPKLRRCSWNKVLMRTRSSLRMFY